MADNPTQTAATLLLAQREFEKILEEIPEKAKKALEAQAVFNNAMGEYEEVQRRAAQARAKLLDAVSSVYSPDDVQNMLNYTPGSLYATKRKLFGDWEVEL